MPEFAIINTDDVVENIIVAEQGFSPPEGRMVPTRGKPVRVGSEYDPSSDTFIEVSRDPVTTLKGRVEDLEQRVTDLETQ